MDPGVDHQELTLQASLVDSPRFRAHLQLCEDQVDEFARWIESLSRSLRTFLDDFARMNESMGRLEPILEAAKDLAILDASPSLPDAQSSLASLPLLLHTLREVNDRLLVHLGQRVLMPLGQACQAQVSVQREGRRSWEKALDRYEAAVNRYGSLNKSREQADLLKEDAQTLYEARMLYLNTLFEHVQQVRQGRRSLALQLVERVQSSLNGLQEWSNLSCLNGCKAEIEAHRAQLPTWQRKVVEGEGEDERVRLQVEQEARERLNPNRSSVSSSNSAIKEGWVFKRRVKSLASPWKRVFLCIRDGMVAMEMAGRRRGLVEVQGETNVLLCEVRKAEGQERRFCFELFTSQR